MTFNIGSQRADLINNVAGNQTIHGGQHVISSPAEALATLEILRAELETVRMSQAKKRTAKKYVEEMEQQLHQKQPDKPSIADRLTRLTKILVAAGALLTGGTALGQAIGGLASWLGTLGAGIFGLVSPSSGG